MRVLLVDKSGEFRSDLSRALTDRGHSTTGVASAARAVEELHRREYDVMFTDLQVGRQTGLELLRHARESWPRMLVVMVTGNPTVEPAIRALQLGAFDYIRKPVTPGQVDRVLHLVSEQLALTRTGAKPLDPVRYAAALAAEGGYEVLLISPAPVRRPGEHVRLLPLDPDHPFRIRAAVEEFVGGQDRAAVVLTAIDELLARHREEEIAALLEGIRSVLEGKGPLAVGYDPRRITATGALTVRASIVSADAHTTLESLASPIRRLVLRRLREGPATFSQAMEAARIDDTSLIAFHLRKLTESGLVVHVARGRYRLSSRGQGAIRILGSVDELDLGKGSGNRVFPSRTVRGRGRPTVRMARRRRARSSATTPTTVTP